MTLTPLHWLPSQDKAKTNIRLGLQVVGGYRNSRYEAWNKGWKRFLWNEKRDPGPSFPTKEICSLVS